MRRKARTHISSILSAIAEQSTQTQARPHKHQPVWEFPPLPSPFRFFDEKRLGLIRATQTCLRANHFLSFRIRQRESPKRQTSVPNRRGVEILGRRLYGMKHIDRLHCTNNKQYVSDYIPRGGKFPHRSQLSTLVPRPLSCIGDSFVSRWGFPLFDASRDKGLPGAVSYAWIGRSSEIGGADVALIAGGQVNSRYIELFSSPLRSFTCWNYLRVVCVKCWCFGGRKCWAEGLGEGSLCFTRLLEKWGRGPIR